MLGELRKFLEKSAAPLSWDGSIFFLFPSAGWLLEDFSPFPHPPKKLFFSQKKKKEWKTSLNEKATAQAHTKKVRLEEQELHSGRWMIWG